MTTADPLPSTEAANEPYRAPTGRLIRGDCIEVMRSIPSGSIGAIVTDPPYLVRYRSRDGRSIDNDDNDSWLDPAFVEACRVLKPDSFCVSFYGWHQIDRFMAAWRQAGFRPVGHFVCTKRYASGQGYTRRQHESAFLLAKGRPAEPSNPPRDILPWAYTGNKLHPTQKPVEALLPLINAYSAPGETVLDPFAGSGTTGDGCLPAGPFVHCHREGSDLLREGRGASDITDPSGGLNGLIAFQKSAFMSSHSPTKETNP